MGLIAKSAKWNLFWDTLTNCYVTNRKNIKTKYLKILSIYCEMWKLHISKFSNSWHVLDYEGFGFGEIRMMKKNWKIHEMKSYKLDIFCIPSFSIPSKSESTTSEFSRLFKINCHVNIIISVRVHAYWWAGEVNDVQ